MVGGSGSEDNCSVYVPPSRADSAPSIESVGAMLKSWRASRGSTPKVRCCLCLQGGMAVVSGARRQILPEGLCETHGDCLREREERKPRPPKSAHECTARNEAVNLSIGGTGQDFGILFRAGVESGSRKAWRGQRPRHGPPHVCVMDTAPTGPRDLPSAAAASTLAEAGRDVHRRWALARPQPRFHPIRRGGGGCALPWRRSCGPRRHGRRCRNSGRRSGSELRRKCLLRQSAPLAAPTDDFPTQNRPGFRRVREETAEIVRITLAF